MYEIGKRETDSDPVKHVVIGFTFAHEAATAALKAGFGWVWGKTGELKRSTYCIVENVQHKNPPSDVFVIQSPSMNLFWSTAEPCGWTDLANATQFKDGDKLPDLSVGCCVALSDVAYKANRVIKET